jgi:hypothetical protein
MCDKHHLPRERVIKQLTEARDHRISARKSWESKGLTAPATYSAEINMLQFALDLLK